MADRNEILRKVQLLLDKADSTTFDAERDAFIEKADALMISYAIESHELDKDRRGADRAEKVVIRRVTIGLKSIIRDQLVGLASAVAGHVRCRIVIHGSGSAISFIGFEADTEYAEMLFTSLWMQLTAKLEPKPDPDLSDPDNVIMLLENGQNRRRVCELLGWTFEKDHGKVSKIWRRHVEELGEYYQPRSRTHPTSYARNFASAYADEVSHRLFVIRDRRGDYDRHDEDSTAIVLKDRDQMVKEAFNEMFPKLGTYRSTTQARYDSAAQRRGERAGRQADLGQPRVRQTPAIGGA